MTQRRPMVGGRERAIGLPSGEVARVTTMLTPDERLRIDAVGMGWMYAFHRESLEDLWRDLRGQRVRALILSTAMCQRANIGTMARMVREFPRVPAVALLSEFDRATVRTVLSLGQCGIRTLIDVRDPNGWRELRSVLLSERASEVQRMALSRLALDLLKAPPNARRFFELLFTAAASTPSVRELASRMSVHPGTLMSRFFRAKLPPPKRYLAFARLTCAAHLFENPGVSVASVSDQLNYSSPQSFTRHVRALLQLSAVEFRLRYDSDGMMECFRERLVLPHLEEWQRFDPFSSRSALRPIVRRHTEGRTGPTAAATVRHARVAEELLSGDERENLVRVRERHDG
jgi:AraC-like DNA-binding protein